MSDIPSSLPASLWNALAGDPAALTVLRFTGDGSLPSAFAVTDLAAAAIAAAALAVAELIHTRGHARPLVQIDRRLASFWFASSLRPIGWKVPGAWDSIAGDYRTSDGWIRLHTNAPHHRAAVERVLGPHAGREAVAHAVATWSKADLEHAIVDSGGCAAQMFSIDEWRAHPQGRAVASEPLIHTVTTERATARDWPIQIARPLAGIRVLDLTRVLAGPVASRFLAGYGADVLRVDPPSWNEPGVVPETTLGKRCARLDLTNTDDRIVFEILLSEADVLLHGYRADALDRLGYDAAARARLRPGLIDVSLNAYGWSGALRNRRGFDSLLQMSTGIADAGMRWKNADRPVPLPVQALDHATGYLMAGTVVRGITRRLIAAHGTQAKLSLARTAQLLIDQNAGPAAPTFAAESAVDVATAIERTAWGDARRLIVPVTIDCAPMRWDTPATELGSAEPRWL